MFRSTSAPWYCCIVLFERACTIITSSVVLFELIFLICLASTACPMTKRELLNDKERVDSELLADPKLLSDPKCVRALGMVVAKARPQDPLLHAAFIVCRHFFGSRATSELKDVLIDVLLSSLANPHALVHWPLLGHVSVSFFPLRSA